MISIHVYDLFSVIIKLRTYGIVFHNIRIDTSTDIVSK